MKGWGMMKSAMLMFLEHFDELLKCRYWAIPICTEQHWSVYILDSVAELVKMLVKDQLVVETIVWTVHLDSLGKYHSEHIKHVATALIYSICVWVCRKQDWDSPLVPADEWSKAVHGEKMTIALGIKRIEVDVPQQGGTYDCGIRTLFNLNCFTKNVDYLSAKNGLRSMGRLLKRTEAHYANYWRTVQAAAKVIMTSPCKHIFFISNVGDRRTKRKYDLVDKDTWLAHYARWGQPETSEVTATLPVTPDNAPGNKMMVGQASTQQRVAGNDGVTDQERVAEPVAAQSRAEKEPVPIPPKPSSPVVGQYKKTDSPVAENPTSSPPHPDGTGKPQNSNTMQPKDHPDVATDNEYMLECEAELEQEMESRRASQPVPVPLTAPTKTTAADPRAEMEPVPDPPTAATSTTPTETAAADPRAEMEPVQDPPTAMIASTPTETVAAEPQVAMEPVPDPPTAATAPNPDPPTAVTAPTPTETAAAEPRAEMEPVPDPPTAVTASTPTEKPVVRCKGGLINFCTCVRW